MITSSAGGALMRRSAILLGGKKWRPKVGGGISMEDIDNLAGFAEDTMGKMNIPWSKDRGHNQWYHPHYGEAKPVDANQWHKTNLEPEYYYANSALTPRTPLYVRLQSWSRRMVKRTIALWHDLPKRAHKWKWRHRVD